MWRREGEREGGEEGGREREREERRESACVYVYVVQLCDYNCRLYLRDVEKQALGIPCVLQKFNKNDSLSEEAAGLVVSDSLYCLVVATLRLENKQHFVA